MDSYKVSNKKLKNDFMEKVPCTLCGSANYEIIYCSKYGEKSFDEIINIYRASGDDLLTDQLVKCKSCSLIYVNPRIKSDLIIKGYSEGSDETFVSQADSRESTFDKSLKLIETFSRGKGRLLDVGTAGGSFLAAAKKRGWKVHGCEPNKWLANWGNKKYGLEIKAGTLFEQKYDSEYFDVVTLWDVIEHTPDPSAVLKECNRILKKEGILVVNYPDIGSVVAKIMRRKWLFLTSVHLYYFTRKTISDILAKNGFRKLVVKPHFQTLQAGYIFFRAGKYNKFISGIGQAFVKTFGLESKGLPYWLGQTFVLAVKK